MFDRFSVCLLLVFFVGTLPVERSCSAEDGAPTPKEVKVAAEAVGGAAFRAVSATDVRRAAEKQIKEAIAALEEANKTLRSALKSASTAKNEEAQQAALKQIEQAKAKLAEAEKALAKKREEAKRRAAVALQGRRYYSSRAVVRKEVDPQDPIERFAILTAGGPIVVEASMTIDGKPFRELREQLIDEMLSAADSNNDGKATWEEALKTPRFTLGRVRILNEQQRDRYLKNFDTNLDDLVDRFETRRFLAQYFQGSAFAISGSSGSLAYSRGRAIFVNSVASYPGSGQASVQKLLDTDEDGVLSEQEIAAASERLKSRDGDDNDLLLASEISSPTGTQRNRVIRAYPQTASQNLALLLGPTATSEVLFRAIQEKYKNEDNEIVADSFSAVPKLFESLDKNKDKKLQQDEVLTLNNVKPHVELVVELSKSEGAKGLTVKSVAPHLESKAAKNSISLQGVNVVFTANTQAMRTYNYEAGAKAQVARYDQDKNNYLEKKELPANIQRQFEVWDGDSDGKVYAKEIAESYARGMAPQQSQIRASVSTQGDPLFKVLDQTGDNRLSLREMKTAQARIKAFDQNGDNRITSDEIPTNISLAFALGSATYSYYQRGRTVQATSGVVSSDTPQWFTRMDRNGDGDVTLKEFLGSKEDFEKLDSNGDGFIEPKEAKAAKSSKE